MYHVKIDYPFFKDIYRFSSPQNSLGRYIAPNKLLSSYSWDGCRDYTALLCMPSALSLWGALARNLRERVLKSDRSSSSSSSSSSNHTSDRLEAIPVDLSNIREHNQRTLFNATDMLSHQWGVHSDCFAAPYSMRVGSPMSLVSQERTDYASFDCMEWHYAVRSFPSLIN